MRWLLLLSLFLGGSFGFADPVLDQTLGFLSPDDRAALLKDRVLTVFSDRFAGLHLGKGSPFEASAKVLFEHRASTLAAEALFLVPAALPKDPAVREQILQKALTSVSTMKNLQVYSISLKKMETFLFDAYRTQTLDKQTRLPDPDISSPGPVEFILFQKEEQTGESFSRYAFSHEPGWFQVTQTNLTSLNYGIIPLVAPQDLLTAVYVVPFDDQLLVYGVSVAKTFSLFGLEKSKTASLYTRMEALVTWFTNNLKGTPGT